MEVVCKMVGERYKFLSPSQATYDSRSGKVTIGNQVLDTEQLPNGLLVVPELGSRIGDNLIPVLCKRGRPLSTPLEASPYFSHEETSKYGDPVIGKRPGQLPPQSPNSIYRN